MSRHLLRGALALLLVTGAAFGVQTPQGGPATPTAARADGSLILTVEIDHRGVRVVQAVRRPELGYRARKHEDGMPFRWTVRDATGAAIADGGFEPAEVCLDPAHAGQPPHVSGCVVTPHVGHHNLKVPDLATAATIEFARRDAGGAVRLGSVARDQLPFR